MRSVLAVVLAALILAPLGAHAADLIVWWDKGFYAQEDEAIAEVVAAFEQKTGKHAELAHFRRRNYLTRSRLRSMPVDRPTLPTACGFPKTSGNGP
jgi:ABC-type glycerol-3-phosphate transport system substrate-binding protein